MHFLFVSDFAPLLGLTNSEELKWFVEEEVKKLSPLKVIIQEIKNRNKQNPLRPRDLSVIKQIYSTSCTGLALQDIFLDEKIWNESNMEQLLQLIWIDNFEKFLKKAETLNLNSKYLSLIEDKEEFYNEQSFFLRQLQADGLMAIKSRSECLNDEITFVENLENSLHHHFKVLVEKLNLSAFCRDEINLNTVLDNIKELNGEFSRDELIGKLKRSAESLWQNEVRLLGQVKEIIKSYLDFDYNVIGQDNVVVKRKVLVLSDVLTRIEDSIGAGEIKNVHLMAGKFAHIDEDLKNEIWNGVNVVICAQEIAIHGKRRFDLSGEWKLPRVISKLERGKGPVVCHGEAFFVFRLTQDF